MSDQPTRATAPNADPRQPFTLDAAQAELILAASANGQDFLNQSWSDLGERLGFVWTTVADLEWIGGSTREDNAVVGATFTAWPGTITWVPDPDAEAYLNSMVVVGDPTQLKNRELILRAWADGRDTGFAMGSATAQANEAVLGWDGMELIHESAELFREYETHNRADARWHADAAMSSQADHDDAQAKAERNAAQAEKLEAFLADPTQAHLVHDGLREAREDAGRAVAAGWHKALGQVKHLVATMKGQFGGSTIPPLALQDRLEELAPPEDVDGVLQPLRDPMAQVERQRIALAEWFEKTAWVDEAQRAGLFKGLGLKPQYGRHKADILRTLVERLNTLAHENLARTLSGLHVQAAADVLQAIGIGAEKRGPVLELEVTVDGLFPGDPGYKDATSARYPIAEGLECMGKPDGEA